MKLGTIRHIAPWMLLAVFVPMLVFSSLHVHEDNKTVVATECSDCVRHSCHGHMTTISYWSHDCVLCQFLTLTFVVTTAVCLIVVNNAASIKINVLRRKVCVAYGGIVGLRAPPAFSI